MTRDICPYVCTMLDVFTHQSVGRAMGGQIIHKLVLELLRSARATRKLPQG